MAVETADYITELKKANPLRDDPIAQGDEHIRLIKHVLTETFPFANGPQASVVDPVLDEGSIIVNSAGKWRETNDVRISASGDITCRNLTASQNVVSQSDERLKEKHSTIDDALDKVKTLDTFTYLPNERGVECGMPYVEQAGVSAQQVQAVFPQAVQQTDNGYLAVDYSRLCVLLLEAVKELSHKVENQA
jgi:hypothetical protein